MHSPPPGKRLGKVLAAVFALAMVMGPGPGLLLVNQPEQLSLFGILEIPYLYAWGLLWYGVEAGCVLLAYFFVWRESAGNQKEGQQQTPRDRDADLRGRNT